MDVIYFWGIIIAGVILAVAVFYYFYRYKKKNKRSDHYLQALENMLVDDKRQAIEKLKKTVKEDTENIEAYIKLGNLLREQGLAKNAVRIHSDLTFRNNVSKTQRINILEALFEDYHQARDWTSMSKTGKKLLAISKSEEVLDKYLKALEKIEQWDEAISVLEEYNFSGPKIKEKLALYKVMKGLQVAEEKDGHEARLVFKEAIKLNNKCAAAYYYIGLSYYLEERFDDSLEFWKKLAFKVPEKAKIVLGQVEKTYYELGQFPKVETFYKELLTRFPDSFPPVAAMAGLHAKKGNWPDAFKLLEKFIAHHPDDKIEAQKVMFKLSLNSNNNKKAVEIARELLNVSETNPLDRFQCSECSYISEEPEWYCPKCKSLNTFGE